MRKEIGIIFITLGLLALLAGLFFGSIASLQVVFPGFPDHLSFIKVRPLHVSLMVAWIFLSAIGGIYYYIPQYCRIPLYSEKLPRIHFWMFFLTGITILSCYFLGKFGGREYWEFPAFLSIPILISWGVFGWNYFRSVFRSDRPWPVYLWMWSTGIVFFLITFIESYLWLLPYFGDNLIRDITVQWKAYGALTGSWNMLVYGTAIFVMERIKGDFTISHSRLSFLMYFLGFTNLLFGWAHHIYTVPTAPWIRILSYIISMTELLILARIIWTWKNSLRESQKYLHILPYRFILASDVWILLNLTLAMAISIPAINMYTHGTHVTVAHAMGSTIGINSMILLASCFFLIMDVTKCCFSPTQSRIIKFGFQMTNVCLLIFWLALFMAGIQKGILVVDDKHTFNQIMQYIHPALAIFSFAGIGVFVGFCLMLLPLLKPVFAYLKK